MAKKKIVELTEEQQFEKAADAAPETDVGEGDADGDGTGDAPAAVDEASIPEKADITAALIKKMSMEELNAVVDYHNFAATPWLGETAAAKRKALISFLNLGPKASPALNDPLMKASNEIENLEEQADIESRIDTLLNTEGMNDFVLGGLLQKLSEKGEFGDQRSFRDHVEARFEKLKFRKARYLMQLYNGLIQAGVGWGEVSDIGWTKLIELLPVLTAENVAEWVEKAKNLTVASLREAVKAALKAEQSGESTMPVDAEQLKNKSFKLYPQQYEVVEDALNDAMEKGQTKVPSAALEYICLDYLASAGKAPTASVDNDKALSRLQKRVKELEEELAEASGKIEASGEISGAVAALDFNALLKAKLLSEGGDVVKTAMAVLEAIDAVLPSVQLNIESLGGEVDAPS